MHDDVKMMYEKHVTKKSVLLWCYTAQLQRRKKRVLRPVDLVKVERSMDNMYKTDPRLMRFMSSNKVSIPNILQEG